MGLTRRVIFPALRILIWAVIAAALVTIALGRGSVGSDIDPDGAGAIEPGANFSDSLITPMVGDIENRVTLTGKITPDDAREVKAGSAGTVSHVWLGSGDSVEQGAPLVVLKQLLGEGDDENLFTTTTVWADASGTVTLDLEVGAEVEVGDVVAKISSPKFIVESEVEPHQLYQLLDAPGTASVKITNGPPEFTCSNFTTKVVEGEDGASTQARCFVPSDVVVFPGLTATIEVVTDSAEGVLLLPITAVEGTVGTGKVWQRDVEGELAPIEVTLGLTDGEMIEIVSGLDETDEILEFVPSLDEPVDPEWGGPGWEEENPEDWGGEEPGDEEWIDEDEMFEE